MDMFKSICRRLDLGELLSQPRPLTGGLMHRMYALCTTKGHYAVKLLNPYVMQREGVLDHFRTAEALEQKLEQTAVPILPALTFGGSKMQQIDGQYFYVFDYYEGRALRNEEITPAHCRIIGGHLARIHGVERRAQSACRHAVQVDWDGLIARLSTKNEELYALLSPHRDLLYDCQRRGNRAMDRLPPVVAVCHNDMDSKNVLWQGKDCRIIDLECLCYASPYAELYETALYWAGYETGRLNTECLRTFVDAYAAAGGILPTDCETLYDGSCGRLEWLAYNLRRALGLDGGGDEIDLGVRETRKTIGHILYYHEARDTILACLGGNPTERDGREIG